LPLREVLTGIVVDYNSWIDTPKSKKLAKTLDKDTILVEGKGHALALA
jgi:hypothetical protein